MIVVGDAQISTDDEVFILDVERRDGSRYVTSVGTPGSVAAAKIRHGGVAARVSHWKRNGERFNVPLIGDALDWRLNERYDV